MCDGGTRQHKRTVNHVDSGKWFAISTPGVFDDAGGGSRMPKSGAAARVVVREGRQSAPARVAPILRLAVAASLLAPQCAIAAVNVFDPFLRYREDEQKVFFQQLPNETVDPFTGTLSIVQEDLF